MTAPDPISLAGRSDAATLLAAGLPENSVWQAEPGVIHIVGHHACRTTLRDPERFSSDGSRYGPTGLGGAAAPARTMNAADPPEHSALRDLVAAAFTAEKVREMEPDLDRLAEEVVDAAVAGGSFDAVRDLAGPFVQRALARLLGLPDHEVGELQQWSDALTSPSGRHDVEVARRVLGERLAEVMDAPRPPPEGSLLLMLRRAERSGVVSPEQALGTAVLMVQAGAETSRNLLSSTVLTLCEHPGLLDRIRHGHPGQANLIEEAFRLHSPVSAAVRYTTGPTELDGVALEERCPVFVWLGAANRDPSVFPDPERFDPDRRGSHLALGTGVHRCLGSHLARAQARAFLGALGSRVDSIELAGDVVWLPSPLARGPLLVPVRVALRGARLPDVEQAE